MKFIKKIFKKLVLQVLVLLVSLNLYAQEPKLTQSFANPLKLNPAIMGNNSDLVLYTGYRQQWAVVGDGFKTMHATFLYPLLFNNTRDKLDFGVQVLQDKGGAFTNMDFSISSNYNLQITKSGNNLSFSLQGGFLQKGADLTGLTFDDQYVLGSYDAKNVSVDKIAAEKVSAADVGAGLMWYFLPSEFEDKRRLFTYFGISGFHLNTPNLSFYSKDNKLPRIFSFQGGFKFIGKGNISISPNARFTTQEGARETAVGVYANYSGFIIGAWYKDNDAVSLIAGFGMKYFALAYSYDVVTSGVGKVVNGANAHEISLCISYDRTAIKKIEKAPSIFPKF